jgi:type IV secretion system protein TrbL
MNRSRLILPVLSLLLVSPIAETAMAATINAADFGLSESGDNTQALQAAFNAARPGDQVILPNGRFAYSSQLRVDGIRVSGSGNTVLAPSNPANQRIILTGNGPSLSNMTMNYKPIIRSGKGVERAGVWVDGAQGFNVDSLTLDGGAYGIPQEGGGGNLFIRNSQGGTIRNNNINYALADSIHITGGSSGVDVTGNRIFGSNDDGIAVVDYGGSKRTGNVRISGNTVLENRWGRNITAVGASNVQITNNYIRGNTADGAGVYIASEPAYDTAAPRNILVEGNQIQDTGGPGKGHGQIMLWSGQGAISDVTVRDNEVRESKRDDLAVVVSGPMNNVTFEGNQIDGQISERGSAGYRGSGNTTNDPAMDNGAPIPVGTPLPNLNGGIIGVAGDPVGPTGPNTGVPPATNNMQPIPPAPTPPVAIPPTVIYPPATTYTPPSPPAPTGSGNVTGLSQTPFSSGSPTLQVGMLDELVNVFKSQAKAWEGTLSSHAARLFGILAVIEVVWVVGWGLVGRKGLDDMIALVAEQIIVIGFFYWLMLNTASFIMAIIDSFGVIANEASVAGGGMANLGPTDIIAVGANMAKVVWDGMTIMNIPFSILLCLVGVINIYVFAKIGSALILVLIESTFAAYAGIVLMGFGGTRFTRDFAISVYRYGISVGVKRLFLQLIIGLGQGVMVNWASKLGAEGALSWSTVALMIGMPIVMLTLAETLPQQAQNLVMGSYTGGSSALAHNTAMAGAAGAAMAAGLAGGGAATKAAFQLAKTQLEERQSSGTGGVAATRMGRAAQIAGMSVKNLGSAAASDVGRRMSGSGGRNGLRSWRIASDLQNKRKNGS